jgi:hypothetical protein
MASFRINGGERRFPSQLIEDQKNKVSGSTPRCLYCRGKLKWPLRTHVRDSEWNAWHFDFFAIQVVQHPVHYEWGLSLDINNVNPTGVVSHPVFTPKLNAFLYVCQDQVSYIKRQIVE